MIEKRANVIQRTRGHDVKRTRGEVIFFMFHVSALVKQRDFVPIRVHVVDCSAIVASLCVILRLDD